MCKLDSSMDLAELERAATLSRNQPDVKDQDMDDSMRMLFGSIHESRVKISPRELQRRKTPEEKEAALQGRLSTGTLRLLYEDLHRNKGANVRSLATKYGVKEEVLQEVLKQYSLPVTPAIN